MHTALVITAVGSAVLFGSLGCLVALMYLLTSRWLFPKDERPERRPRSSRRKRKLRAGGDLEARRVTPRVTPRSAGVSALEHERRLKAVAVAVTAAYAGMDRAAVFNSAAPSEWTLLHRARGLNAPLLRRKAKS
jgi:hypothetical protein